MALVNVDLVNYDALDSNLLTPIPPGDYEVEIVGSRLGQSGTSSANPPVSSPEGPAQPGRSASPHAFPREAESLAHIDPGGTPPREAEGLAHPGRGASPPPAVEFEFVVLGPVCRGTKLRDSFTLGDDASMRKLKTLAVSAGCPDPDFIRDTDELHGLRCRVRVELTGGLRSFGRKNVIAGYSPGGGRFAFRTTPPRTSAPCRPQPNSGPPGPAGPKPFARSYPWDE